MQQRSSSSYIVFRKGFLVLISIIFPWSYPQLKCNLRLRISHGYHFPSSIRTWNLIVVHRIIYLLARVWKVWKAETRWSIRYANATPPVTSVLRADCGLVPVFLLRHLFGLLFFFFFFQFLFCTWFLSTSSSPPCVSFHLSASLCRSSRVKEEKKKNTQLFHHPRLRGNDKVNRPIFLLSTSGFFFLSRQFNVKIELCVRVG